MDIQKFQRKSFDVRGAQVTEDNFDDFERWTGGKILADEKEGVLYIKIDVKHPLNEKQTRAYLTDWVLQTKKGFKVYTDKAFKANFEVAGARRSDFVLRG